VAEIPAVNFLGEALPNDQYEQWLLANTPGVAVWSTGEVVRPEQAPQVLDYVRGEFLAKCDGTTPETVGYNMYCFWHQCMEAGSRLVVPDPGIAHPAAPPAPAPSGPPRFVPGGPAPALPPEQHPDPAVAAAAAIVAPALQQQTPAPEEHVPSAKRVEFAQSFGGPVDCVIVPIHEAQMADMEGRVDANQLVGLAEAEGLRQVTDPESLRFREDRRVAERVFHGLLTQHPRVYVLTSGFEWIIPEHYIPLLVRRICSGGMRRKNEWVTFRF
jgi:hypothetical protein